jgi:acetyltransferase EpsM
MVGAVAARRRVLILGTGGFAEEVADVISDCESLEAVALVETTDRSRCAHEIRGFPVLWVDDIADRAADHLAVCALGSTTRHTITDRVAALGFRFATVQHPTAHVSSSASLGDGTIVSPGVIVAAHATIGRHVILNRGAMVGHHTSVGDHVSVMTGANVAGACTIGERTYIGMGALVLNNISVGASSVIGAGSLVTRDVAARMKVMGSPARVVAEGVDGR